jgi:hypothetical protein
MIVRWRGKTPQEGYEKFTEQGWVPVTKEEIDEESRRSVITWEPAAQPLGQEEMGAAPLGDGEVTATVKNGTA